MFQVDFGIKRGSHRVEIGELVKLALGGLGRMYHEDCKAFCYRTELKGNVLVKRGISTTNTLITLIGIRKAELAGHQPPIEMNPALSKLCDSVLSFNSIGDIGLYLWLLSMYGGESVESQFSRIELGSALERYGDARGQRTMELSWFLAGLSETVMASHKLDRYTDLAAKTFRLIKANQESSGLFRHSSATGSLSGRVRSRMASFADQIFPIYAFSRYSLAFGIDGGSLAASSCANRICGLQGPLGQWWWHYDSVRGTVIGKYPVYSVHQDGMAPMALFALSQTSGIDLSPAVYKGLKWICGQNELNVDLRNSELSVIWRNIHQPAQERYLEEALRFFFGRNQDSMTNDLKILFECHPYHLGWLLFALAPLNEMP